MTDDADFNAALDPTFFDGRLLIEITAWDWNLRLTIAPVSPLMVKFSRYGRFAVIDFTDQFLLSPVGGAMRTGWASPSGYTVVTSKSTAARSAAVSSFSGPRVRRDPPP